MDSRNDFELDARASEVTQLLARVRAGERDAWSELLARVETELHRLAHLQMEDERTGHLLQTTALVNEAFLRLVRSPGTCEHRGEFFAVAASAMRHVLVDEARRRKSLKRGGGAHALTISQLAEVPADAEGGELDLEAVDRALASLENDARHAKKSKLVELRFFAGLTLEETADVLGVSLATVKRDWEFARAWLKRELTRAAPGS